MFAKSFLVLASAALAMATPCVKTTPTLPVNGGGTELPSPPSGVTLKHIALGFGIQNYTCADVDATATSIGALAVLYDITSLYPKTTRNSLSINSWNKLTSTVLNGYEDPITDDVSNPFPAEAPLKISGVASMPFLGHHYFDSSSIPTFDLGSELLKAKKLAAVDAPASADPGPDGTGAVAWLELGDAGTSVGLSYVYRVLTAGGNSHGCSAAGTDTTAYTAQYWFYG